MKKSLFAAALIIAAALFTACKQEQKNAVQSISLKPSELPLTPGATSRLSVVVEPENAKYNDDDLVWASSDTTVAVVSANGTVTALASGTANVTVKLGDLSAVCAVTVKEWVESLVFTGAYVGMTDSLAYCGLDTFKLDTIESSAGDTYYVRRVKSYVALFTAGFYIDNEGKLAGSNEGGMVEAYGPMYLAPGWANGREGDVYFCLGEWVISDRYGLDTVSNVLPCGKTNDEYIANMKLFLENIMAGDETTAYSINMAAAGEEGCEGAVMKHYQYHTVAEGYPSDSYFSEYVPALFFSEGYLYLGDNYAASNRLCSIEGHHLTARELGNEEVNDTDFILYGCYWHYDEASQGYSWVDENVHFADKTYSYDYNLEIFQAPSRDRSKRYIQLSNVGDIEKTKKVMEQLHSVPAAPKALRK